MSNLSFKISFVTILKYLIGLIVILFGSTIIAQGAVMFGSKIVALVVIPLVLFSLYNYRYGVVLLFIYGASLFQVSRMLESDLPFGVLFDLLIILSFLSILISKRGVNKHNFKLSEPITIINIIFYLYFALEVLNPSATSVAAWFAASRFYTVFILYFVLITYFDKKEAVKYFVYIWLSIALVAALYGIQQEIFGLMDFEWKYIYASEVRYNLFYNWGHMRVFSILPDPTAFGLFMAFSGLGSLILSFGPFSMIKKFLLMIMTIIIFTSMVFSGTRTAFAMVMIGVIFFIILNIKQAKVLAGSMVLIVAFLILMFGPFYSGPIQRLRSTFDFSDDPSMNVRDIKRVRFQNYIQQHPIGGGVNTAGNNGLIYSPGHLLAGNFDPDSGYLRTALELGWIGLILFMSLNLTVVVKGILNNYSLKDRALKAYNIAFIVPFFALSVANYTQDAMLQKPIVITVIATYALMIKLNDLDSGKSEL